MSQSKYTDNNPYGLESTVYNNNLNSPNEMPFLLNNLKPNPIIHKNVNAHEEAKVQITQQNEELEFIQPIQ